MKNDNKCDRKTNYAIFIFRYWNLQQSYATIPSKFCKRFFQTSFVEKKLTSIAINHRRLQNSTTCPFLLPGELIIKCISSKWFYITNGQQSTYFTFSIWLLNSNRTTSLAMKISTHIQCGCHAYHLIEEKKMNI